MEATTHPTNNLTLTPPPGVGDQDCATISATVFKDVLPSGQEIDGIACFWKPNAEELAMLNQGNDVVVMFWGTRVVPHSVTVASKEAPQ